MKKIVIALLPSLWVGACLNPPIEEVPGTRFYGPSSTEVQNSPWIDNVERFQNEVALFPTEIAYLKGYAEGKEINYWNIPGPNSDLIAPVFQLIRADSSTVGNMIIDVVPGQQGYTPWWRLHQVEVTEKYQGEVIWSREAIDAALRDGLVKAPKATTRIINGPVVAQGTKVPVSDSEQVLHQWVWFRGMKTAWIQFSQEHQVPTTERIMPAFPVYVFQRINQAYPIYEFLAGVDLDGDSLLNRSNNVFADAPNQDRYSPLWYLALVRTSADYVSIDTSSTSVGFSAESDFLQPPETLTHSQALNITSMKNFLINCPIQEEEGKL